MRYWFSSPVLFCSVPFKMNSYIWEADVSNCCWVTSVIIVGEEGGPPRSLNNGTHAGTSCKTAESLKIPRNCHKPSIITAPSQREVKPATCSTWLTNAAIAPELHQAHVLRHTFQKDLWGLGDQWGQEAQQSWPWWSTHLMPALGRSRGIFVSSRPA